MSAVYLTELKLRLARVFAGTEAEELSVRLADALSLLPLPETRFLTFKSLQNISGASDFDVNLVQVVGYMASSEFSVLSSHALFVDDYGQEFDLDAEDYESVMKDNELAHPQTGDLIENPRVSVIPYFSLREPLVRGDLIK